MRRHLFAVALVSFEETIAAVVRAAVREAVAPLEAELARLRMAEEDRGVTVQEAAERLGVSTRTVQRQIKAGELPALKVGGATRIPLSAVLPRPS